MVGGVRWDPGGSGELFPPHLLRDRPHPGFKASSHPQQGELGQRGSLGRASLGRNEAADSAGGHMGMLAIGGGGSGEWHLVS